MSEIVPKFAKACRLRSIGVFPTENRHHHRDPFPCNAHIARPLTDNCSDATEDSECDGEKVHPQLVEEQIESKEYHHVMLLYLFDTISALKLAYVQLQEAHVPSYDPDKIRAANGIIVSQLVILCKIKHAYKEKKHKKPEVSACLDLLLAEIGVQERLLQRLKLENKVRDVEIASLRREFHDLDWKNRKLTEKLRQKDKENAAGVLDVCSFMDIAKATSKVIHDFAKPLISLMKASGWDLDVAANSIEDSVVYIKRSHKKYAFEAYIARRMFYRTSIKSYNVEASLKYDDPIDILIEEPKSNFAQFCRTKYLLVIHPKMEMTFFGNLDHRKLLSSGRHPRTTFYQAFVKMARWIWILQGIVTSTEPRVAIFGVRRGDEFSNTYMECVVGDKKDMEVSDERQSRFKVEFMVTPGFILGQTLVKSRVYLSKPVMVHAWRGSC